MPIDLTIHKSCSRGENAVLTSCTFEPLVEMAGGPNSMPMAYTLHAGAGKLVVGAVRGWIGEGSGPI